MPSTRTMTSHKPRPPSSSSSLDIKETELRLGLPGTGFPESKHRSAFGSVSAFGLDSGDEDTHLGISLNPTRNSGLGTKRGFFDAIDGCCGNGGGVSGALKSQGCAFEVAIVKDIVSAVFDREEGSSEWEKAKNDRGSQHGSAATVPAAKAQIVGWPPIRSFRKNTTASALAKSSEDVEGKLVAAGCHYVKVSMDGAPYLRKVDLKNYKIYAELLTALEQMFSYFTIASGSRASKELHGGEISLQKQLSDLVRCSEYVLTYEDKDGDWMLVGDVPWRMFAESCRRMRIMKGSEATGLGTEVSRRGHFYVLPSREFMTYSVLAELPDCSGEKCRNRD